MDSDVTADSLSSPEQGFGLLSSFSSQGPPGHARSQYSGAPLDSVDLSPPTDTSADEDGGGFHNGILRRSGDVGQLTPLRESRRSTGDLSNEEEEIKTDNNPARSGAHDVPSRASGLLSESGESVVVGRVPAMAARGDHADRKSSREVATIDGYGIVGWQQGQHRLESSWPISRSMGRSSLGNCREEDPWGRSQPSPPPNFSRGGYMALSPHERIVAQIPSSNRPRDSNRPLGGDRDVERRSVSRSESSNSRSESGSSGRGGIGGHFGGAHGDRGSISASSSDIPLGGGIGETFSISDGSSPGLPAPPMIPSGPLPAMGALREV